MNSKSIKFEPYMGLYGQEGSDNIVFKYIKSIKYYESVSVASIFGDSAQLLYSPSLSNLNEIYDAVSALDNAIGGAGEFIIPAGASGISYDGIYVYSWKKKYKVLLIK